MMKREHVAEYYTDYLEGSLSAPLRDQVEAHLRDCAQCSAELHDLRAMLKEVAALPASLPLPCGFSASVRARIPEHAPARKPLWLSLMLSTGALATASLIILLAYINHPTPRHLSSRVNTTMSLNNSVVTAPNPLKFTPSTSPHHEPAQLEQSYKAVKHLSLSTKLASAILPHAVAHQHASITPNNTELVELALAPISQSNDLQTAQLDSRHNINNTTNGNGTMMMDSAAPTYNANQPADSGAINMPGNTYAYGAASPYGTAYQTDSTVIKSNTSKNDDSDESDMNEKTTSTSPAFSPSVPQSEVTISKSAPPSASPPSTSSMQSTQSMPSGMFGGMMAKSGTSIFQNSQIELGQTSIEYNTHFTTQTHALQGKIMSRKRQLSVKNPTLHGLNSNSEQFSYLPINDLPTKAGALEVALPKSATPPSTQQHIMLRISGRAHALMTFNYIDPPSAAATQITLPASSSEISLHLPKFPNGNAVRFTISHKHQQDSYYLFTPGCVPHPVTLEMRVISDQMRNALQPLANTNNVFIICPADLAERHITFIAANLTPQAALTALAAQEHLHIAKNEQLINITTKDNHN